MAELKTKKNTGDVLAFLNVVEDDQRRKDALEILELMKEITGEEPTMWGDSIVGFGSYQYKYASGREANWFYTGFSPRKQSLTLYIMAGFEKYDTLMEKLGKYSTGKSCLYIKSLKDVDTDVLKKLIELSVQQLKSSQK